MRSSVALAVAFIASSALATACSSLELVYARATTEPPTVSGAFSNEKFDTAAQRSWSKGYGAAGYSLYSNLTATMAGSTGYPVHYPADWTGTSPVNGAVDMANHIKAQSKACPQQKFAIGGHSQGGTVTHSAISNLAKSDAVALAKIIAITTFGDPNSNEALPAVLKGREKYSCLKGDVACGNRNVEAGRPVPANSPKNGGMAHLLYNADGRDIKASVKFIMQQYQKLGGAGGAAAPVGRV